MSEQKTPNPGSDAAIELGCICPVFDNGRGRGYQGDPGVFRYSVGCPVHRDKNTGEPK